MRRIVLDTQSNPVFRKSEYEQAYTLRGGLCEVGRRHVVVLPCPLPAEYLEYWQSLGLSLPKFMLLKQRTGEPKTLAELLLLDDGAMRQLQEIAAQHPARLEFFCVSEHEASLVNRLGIPAYCNVELSRRLESKVEFMRVADDIGLPRVAASQVKSNRGLQEFVEGMLSSGNSIVLKREAGTGGSSTKSVIGPFNSVQKSQTGWDNLCREGESTGLAERWIPSPVELSVQFEITQRGRIVGPLIAEQLTNKNIYIGACWPPRISREQLFLVETRVRKQLGPWLIEQGGLGFYSCDVVISPVEHWMDFNPRKGAVRYVMSMVQRLLGRLVPFVHSRVQLARPTTLEEVFTSLTGLLQHRSSGFVVVSNVGLLPYGSMDVTGIGPDADIAKALVEEALRRLNPCVTQEAGK